ncbi:MAG: DUF459 domain-containing protein [Candidatus Dactylopiibacterium sp.]|nr:DUF459 domain-containing protein [Candidatus Dactylopiibacterium sp.]
MPRRFQPLRQMFLTLLAALLVGLVLDAEGLKIWAQRLEVGSLRTLALPVAEGWHGWVSAVGGESPRRTALALKEAWGERFAGGAREIQSVAQQSAVTEALPLPPAGAASSDPAPQVVVPAPQTGAERSAPRAIAADAPQVVLAGDSMMAVGLAPVLRRGLGVNVVRAYRSGTGLARPEVFDWIAQYPQMVGEAHPQLVICALGANDGQNVQLGRQVLTFGSPEWDAFYRERLTRYLDLLTANDRRVLWIGMPLMRSPAFARKMTHMNALVRDVLKAYPTVSWMDPNPALGYADTAFAQYRADARGKMIKLRADDGIHMTDEGAAFLLPGIRNWLSLHLPPGAETAAAIQPSQGPVGLQAPAQGSSL